MAYIVVMRPWAQYSGSKGSYDETHHEYVLAKHKTAFIAQTFCRRYLFYNDLIMQMSLSPHILVMFCGENIHSGPIY